MKSFNTAFATTRVAGEANGTPLDVFNADDRAARKHIAELLTSGGLNPVDVGALKHACGMESFQLLHMALQIREAGHGWASDQDRRLLSRAGTTPPSPTAY